MRTFKLPCTRPAYDAAFDGRSCEPVVLERAMACSFETTNRIAGVAPGAPRFEYGGRCRNDGASVVSSGVANCAKHAAGGA